ncbi:MAG: MFS transporter [Anaerolineaceae bacterium]|nr:MFS transporter [Anaerolineaceae bacterium]
MLADNRKPIRETSIQIQIALLTLTRMVLNMATRMAYPFLSVFARGLGVDLKTISLVMTFRAATGFVSPFLASLSDIWGHKRGMLAGLAAFVVCNLAIIFFPTFPVFFIGLTITYLGMYIYMASMQAYVGEHVPYEKRGLALAVTEMGWGLSFVVGMPIIAFLIRRMGWAAPFPLLAALGVLMIYLVWRMLPASPPHPTESFSHSSKVFFQNLKVVFTSKNALYGLAMSFFLVAANEVVNLIFGVWIEDSFNLSVTGLGAAALGIGLIELFGELTGGITADKFGKRRMIAVGILLNIAAAAWMAFFSKTLFSALLGLMFFYLSFEFAIVSCFGLISGILPGARATIMGANVAALSLGRMFGAVTVPFLYELNFHWNLLLAVIINLLSLYAMSRVKLQEGKNAIPADVVEVVEAKQT